MEKYTLSGIEKILIGPASMTANLTGMFELENIAPGTVTRTKNADTLERIIAEGKTASYVTFATPGEPDQITISLLDQNPKVEQLMLNVQYDAATSKVTELAARKIANIALQIYTSLKNGKKAIITIPNIDAVLSSTDPLTFNNVEKYVITGDLKGFMTIDGQEAISIKQWFDANGLPINASPATVSAGTATQTATANPKVLTGTATAASPKTIVSQYWTQLSGPSNAIMATPGALSNSVSGLITGTYVFRLTAVDSAGVETSATTTVNATIA